MTLMDYSAMTRDFIGYQGGEMTKVIFHFATLFHINLCTYQ